MMYMNMYPSFILHLFVNLQLQLSKRPIRHCQAPPAAEAKDLATPRLSQTALGPQGSQLPCRKLQME